MKIKNNIITIMKKECTRIFSDKKLFFTAVIMPGLLIYVMYLLMGNLMGGMFDVEENYIYQVSAVNMPASISAIVSAPELNIKIFDVPKSDTEKIRQQVTDKETDLLIIFPPDFDESVAAFDVLTSSDPAPNIQIWSNSAKSESTAAYNLVYEILNGYHYALTHKFSINAPSENAPEGNYELATDADMFAMVIGYMIPMMFLLFIYTGCLTLAPESIAGEKERGTLGSMLVTPAKRSDMALAKIFSISIFGFLSAIVSMAAMIFSLPNLMQMDVNAVDFFSIKEYALLFVVAVSTALVFVSVLSLMSAYAKSIKEATAYATPMMIVVLLCGMGSMLTGGVPEGIYYYLIPVFNSAQCITSILNFNASAANIAATAAANLAFTLICAGILAKIFNSEKIVFDK